MFRSAEVVIQRQQKQLSISTDSVLVQEIFYGRLRTRKKNIFSSFFIEVSKVRKAFRAFKVHQASRAFKVHQASEAKMVATVETEETEPRLVKYFVFWVQKK